MKEKRNPAMKTMGRDMSAEEMQTVDGGIGLGVSLFFLIGAIYDAFTGMADGARDFGPIGVVTSTISYEVAE